jgi:hypothetical protein
LPHGRSPHAIEAVFRPERREAHRTGFTLAEWLCRTADRIDPARVLDHIIVLGEAHLRGILKFYADYYNGVRTHLSLEKDSPVSRAVERAGHIRCRPVPGGLHHQYVRI